MGDMACARQTTARMPGRADPFAPVLLALAVIVLAAALGRRAAGLLGAPATLMLAVMLWPSPAFAGETIEQIKSRRSLRCGVSEGADAGFCRAVAAAALGDPEKITFVPLRASARFPALQLGGIDLLARNTTWTLSREAGLKVVFAGVSFYDAQAFMVPAASSVKSPAQLKGATVCVEKGTTNERNLVDYFAARSLSVTPLVIDSTIEVAEAFFGGRCAAYTADAAHLAAARLRAPEGRAFRILLERISKEPLAPAVRSGDDDWLTLVRWVLFALIAAEEEGITQATARAMGAGGALGIEPELGKALGVDADWALRAVQSVGNYGEMFDRNLGRGSLLKLERGLNRLWKHGGLMYAPPMR